MSATAASIGSACTPLRRGLSLEGHWASQSEGVGRAVIGVEGLRCASCTRKLRGALEALPGVQRVDVNLVNSRASVDWREGQLALPAILEAIAGAGFTPVPLVGERAAAARRAEQRTALKRIGLAGLGTMQLMMYSSALYIGVFDGSDARYAELFRWTCLAIALPVLLYSGAPILRGAWRDLQSRSLGMDVTVALALVLAFLASTFNTLRGAGEVYFESVTMFVFLLLVGRHLEARTRHQAADVTESLARVLPARVQRLQAAHEEPGGAPQARGTEVIESVELAALRPGDRIRVGSGQMVPVDATLLAAPALLDEALITGESLPRRRSPGERVAGGSINLGAALELLVAKLPADSTLQSIVRLVERAQSGRPRLALAAERMASWFIVRILALTALVGLAWMWFDPARAFEAMLAVLVATCPCALSLATPVAAAAATAALARRGLLVVRADAVEALGQIDTVVLDKTGTLTAGRPRIVAIETAPGFEAARALEIAAALEADSSHPLAAAFRAGAAPGAASQCREFAGEGVEGLVEGRTWRIGRRSFVAALGAPRAGATAALPPAGCEGARVVLGDENGIQARFEIADELREDALRAVQSLQRSGLEVRIASGDREGAVRAAALALGISSAEAGMRPDDKLARIGELQHSGRRVLMIGDGINDGPVLAAADVSLAMGQGSGIAHAAADLLLLRDSLCALPEGLALAHRARSIMRQNLRWALGYNLAVLPLAALGWVPPWLAALGMSLSSLLVVLNARRVAARSACVREFKP